MTLNRITGAGIGLASVQNQIPGGGNRISLAAGEVYHPPAGQYLITPGPYTFIQVRNPVTNLWTSIAQTPNSSNFVSFDGYNQRIANLTGCAIGALVTNVGSGYTSAPTITPSAGSSTWQAIVGGAVSSTVTITAAGSGYTYPPVVLISAPGNGGLPATGYATLSGATVASVTIVNQGAGYTAAPTITFVNDPRDTTGSGATATTALTGSGTITAVICTNHGTAVTAVPTLAFSGGGGTSAAATAVMCFTATGITATTAGAGYGNAQPFLVTTAGGTVTTAAGATVNPSYGVNLLTPRPASLRGTSTAGGAITATGLVVNDGGLFSAVPDGITIAGGSGLATTQALATITVGGVTDTSVLVPM